MLLLSTLCIFLYFFLPQEYLAFQRSFIQQGSWYQLITGNFLHTNHWHLVMNLAGLWLITALFHWRYNFSQFSSLILTMALFEGIGLYYFVPDLLAYVGLSGVLHGLFAFGATSEIFAGIKAGSLLLLGVISKVSYELHFGGSANIAELIGARVAVESHLIGAIIGIILALLFFSWQKYSKAKAVNSI